MIIGYLKKEDILLNICCLSKRFYDVSHNFVSWKKVYFQNSCSINGNALNMIMSKSCIFVDLNLSNHDFQMPANEFDEALGLLEHAIHLKYLQLANTPLMHLSFLNTCTKMIWLDLEGCVGNIAVFPETVYDIISSVDSLEFLTFSLGDEDELGFVLMSVVAICPDLYVKHISISEGAQTETFESDDNSTDSDETDAVSDDDLY